MFHVVCWNCLAYVGWCVFEMLGLCGLLVAVVCCQAMPKTAGKGALGARCDFIGSSTNLVRHTCI